MKFLIDRKVWICGNPTNNPRKYTCLGKGETQLLNPEGFMCCLGQVARQLGAKNEDLLNNGVPDAVFDSANILVCNRGGTLCNSDLSGQAIDINDCMLRSVGEKEEALKILFKAYEHEIEFTN